MALQSSGAISLAQIQGEWGGSNPISLSEYYRGSLPTGRTNYGSIPSSGAISFSNFYGTNAATGNWTSIVTVGSGAITNKVTAYGYQNNSPITFGSISDATVNTYSNRTILSLSWYTSNFLFFTVSGNAPNSGWTSLKVGSSTYARTATTYSPSSTSTQFRWNESSNPFGTTTGANVTVEFIV